MDVTELAGWHVVEAGRRQAWPFLTFADPATGREVRLYVDAGFAVEPGWDALTQDDDAAVLALDSLNMRTVEAAEATEGAGLRLDLGEARLRVDGEPNDRTTGEPWRLSPQQA